MKKEWRRRWDSNPRDPEVKLISSQPRYDHFDTSPKNDPICITQITITGNVQKFFYDFHRTECTGNHRSPGQIHTDERIR